MPIARVLRRRCAIPPVSFSARFPHLTAERDELAVTERSDARILGKRARCGLLAIGEWLADDVGDAAIRFLFELAERRHMSGSTVLRTRYAPAEWQGRLGGVRADAMAGRPVRGAIRVNLGDVNVGKLPSRKE